MRVSCHGPFRLSGCKQHARRSKLINGKTTRRGRPRPTIRDQPDIRYGDRRKTRVFYIFFFRFLIIITVVDVYQCGTPNTCGPYNIERISTRGPQDDDRRPARVSPVRNRLKTPEFYTPYTHLSALRKYEILLDIYFFFS